MTRYVLRHVFYILSSFSTQRPLLSECGESNLEFYSIAKSREPVMSWDQILQLRYESDCWLTSDRRVDSILVHLWAPIPVRGLLNPRQSRTCPCIKCMTLMAVFSRTTITVEHGIFNSVSEDHCTFLISAPTSIKAGHHTSNLHSPLLLTSQMPSKLFSLLFFLFITSQAFGAATEVDPQNECMSHGLPASTSTPDMIMK